MTITNAQSGTSVVEVADGIYRINTPLEIPGDPHGFSFNQYLVRDDEPLLYHTGPRRMFALVREAVASVIPVESLEYVAFSHYEADECGSLNDWLAAAPRATPLCGRIGAMTSIGDIADRPARALADGEAVPLGRHTVRWFDTPHLPHGWDAGQMMEEATRTLLCGDLFTQPGAKTPAVTEADILSPSEAFRRALDYYSHTTGTRTMLERLAAQKPTTLACMHGSAWKGDGEALILSLASALADSMTS
jgi:flavorubredoxin